MLYGETMARFSFFAHTDLAVHAGAASAADTPVVVAADALVADTDNTNPNTQLKTITNR